MISNGHTLNNFKKKESYGMKIIEVRTELFPIALKTPFKTALREVQALDVIRVKIYMDNGIIGVGEAAPTPAITGDTQEGILRDIEQHYRPYLLNRELTQPFQLLSELKKLVSHATSAKAAIDIAVFDALAKQQHQPLYQYLGGTRPSLATDYTVSIGSEEKMVNDARAYAQKGFVELKVKMGLDDPEVEVAKLTAMNQALDGKIRFRIDANQGWSPKEAVEIIQSWKGLPIQFIEQPVKAHDIKGMAYVTAHSPFPIMADESLYSLADAQVLIDHQACHMFNIKLMKTAGIQGALEIFRLAKEENIPCMMGSMIEGYVGMAAAIHFAAGMNTITYNDLDVPFMWKLTDQAKKQMGFTINRNMLTLSHQAGLGITMEEGLA